MSDPDFELPTVELPYEVASMDGTPVSGDIVAQDGGILIYPSAGIDEPLQWFNNDRLRERMAEIVSSYTNLVPVIGQVKGVIEGIVGVEWLTGRDLAGWERALNLASAIPHIHGVKGVMHIAGTIGHGAHIVNRGIHQKHAGDVTRDAH